MNGNDIAPTRRAVIGAIGMIAAAPAAALAAPLASTDPVTRFWAAYQAINADKISEEEYCQALDDLDFWDPKTERDFIRKTVAVFHDLSTPSDERLKLLLDQGKRLVGEA